MGAFSQIGDLAAELGFRRSSGTIVPKSIHDRLIFRSTNDKKQPTSKRAIQPVIVFSEVASELYEYLREPGEKYREQPDTGRAAIEKHSEFTSSKTYPFRDFRGKFEG